jgi:(p)ppGpp synthase/HD superfamily hydrolase
VAESLTLIIRATAFAAYKHRNQRRKDAESSPYINHPIALASVLAHEAAWSKTPYAQPHFIGKARVE